MDISAFACFVSLALSALFYFLGNKYIKNVFAIIALLVSLYALSESFFENRVPSAMKSDGTTRMAVTTAIALIFSSLCSLIIQKEQSRKTSVLLQFFSGIVVNISSVTFLVTTQILDLFFICLILSRCH